MIRAAEFRIGNLVYDTFVVHSKEVVAVTELAETQIGVDGKCLKFISDNRFSPITITEEWFLRFGGKQKYFGFWDNEGVHGAELCIGEISFCYSNKFGFQVCFGFDYSIDMKDLLYVHQFQNLVFALTNTELTIKPIE